MACATLWVWTVFSHPPVLWFPLTSLRVTALSYDNGRQLACHASSPASPRPAEARMTMRVFCECLGNVFKVTVNTSLFVRQKHGYPWNTVNRAGTRPRGDRRALGLARSVRVSSPRRNIQPEGKVTPSWRQHECDCLQLFKHLKLPLLNSTANYCEVWILSKKTWKKKHVKLKLPLLITENYVQLTCQHLHWST